MRKLLFLCATLLLISCMSKQEQMIKEFEETFGETKTDLSFKAKEIKFLGSITAKDSIDYYIDIFRASFKYPPETVDELLTTLRREVHYHDSLKAAIANSSERGREYQFYKEVLIKYEPEISFQKRIYEGINKYMSSSPDSVIGNKWECCYTIKNPFLNNVRQEIVNQYLFNADNSKLISHLNE